MKIIILIIISLLSAAINCSSIVKSGFDYVCLMHSRHHLNNRDHVSECFGIKSNLLDDYYLFSKTGRTDKRDELIRAANSIQDKLEDYIIEIIVKKIEHAMGRAIIRHWSFENIKLPVVFRKFMSFDGKFYRIKVVAAIRKEQISPGAIIRYLPLEYKMDLLEKNDKRNKIDRIRRPFQ